MRAPIRRSPLARIHADLGATIEVQAGWEIPATYGDGADERALVRDGVAVADITPRAKIDLRGSLGELVRAAGDGVVVRVTDEWVLVLGEPGTEEILLPKLDSAAGSGAMVTDATHLFGGFALAGPKLPDLLARVTSWDPTTLAPGRAAGAPIAGVPAVVANRDLEIPVLEVYVATELTRYSWETLLGIVRLLGGGPVGWRALRGQGWR